MPSADTPIHPEENSSATARPRPSTVRIPRVLLWFSAAVLAWFLISEGATEAWYRWKESRVPQSVPWKIHWPTPETAAARGFLGFQSRALTDRERELLNYRQGTSYNWRDRYGNRWTSFELEWEEDIRMNDTDIAHNPTVCLPAAGLKYVRAMEQKSVEIGSLSYKFNAWEFSSDNIPIYVFTATRRNRDFEQQLSHAGSSVEARRKTKWFKVFDGQRGNPLQMIQFVVAGPANSESASQLLEEIMQNLSL